MMNISGKTAFAGVIGWPVSHSLSPAIHNHWCAQYGVDAVYVPFPIRPEHLASSLPALGLAGCVGVNLTLPHKELVLSVLDEVDPQARAIGAVNTVHFIEGKIKGYNTDSYGLWTSIEQVVPDIKRRSAFVIGAGGAARAVVAALDQAGYETVYVMNRTLQKAQALQHVSKKVQAVDWFSAPDMLAESDLLVNTTSLGMHGQPALEIALEKLPSHAAVCDIVYAPLKTPLLQSAEDFGLRAVDGLGMLLYQAQKAFEIWFGILPEVTPELRRKVLEARGL